MKTIYCENFLDVFDNEDFAGGSCITLGNFDGCHLGHEKILQKTLDLAHEKKLPSVVFTFNPHPRDFFVPSESPKKLFTLKQKLDHFKHMGFDFVIIQNFNDTFSQIDRETFQKSILKETLQAKFIVVGSNFHFGAGRKGTTKWLADISSKDKIKVFDLALANPNKRLISSSEIRRLLLEGKPAQASKLLGRPFSLEGIIERGLGLGKGLGFPTANLGDIEQLIPKKGVYVGFLQKEKSKRRSLAVINIGHKPTVSQKPLALTVEAHALEHQRDYENAYSEKCILGFYKRLRDEKNFASKEELITQIKKDIERALALNIAR